MVHFFKIAIEPSET